MCNTIWHKQDTGPEYKHTNGHDMQPYTLRYNYASFCVLCFVLLNDLYLMSVHVENIYIDN